MLNNKIKIYISIIVVLGVSFILYSITRINYNDYIHIIIFGIIAAMCESLPIYINKDITVSVAFSVDLMAILVYGPFAASLVSFIGLLLQISKRNDRYEHIFNKPYYKTLFNISQIALSVGAGGLIYKYLGGLSGTFVYPKYIFQAIIAAIVYYFLNNILVTILVSMLLNKPFLKTWTKDFSWMMTNFLFLAFIGVLMASSFIAYGYIALLIFFVPLIMVRYMFKLNMDLKQSYYDTINALTKALEAKDRYTLGHSKSVEKLAVYLCREAGFSEAHTEMVRIAALLHDVGKIGIVENILNKPGKLSKEEYDYIKQHPVSGFEILKDVPFLKNVRYWVRYHHEWYNGNGYPDGISGRQIPLEAEILSVADVFDALVSDRPYRNAYTREEAYKIIVDSEGTQFSPRVIRLFKRAYEKNKEDFKHDF
ncbi:diguanylate cyclase [Thermoanaerobacterium thermosaccharolyticum]|uniref:Diguanylate cyclase n=1 Tax=Thermoanaerobacterium thermosaccharolyticum TaxID=1517 RepID=A0A231VL13_THETR|nr:HD domain-containing phosphohydrolase [Thermoanaerobacterium thermosaccharolyticum]OXT08764.1 diguanylate cyclase [Thermoanaerobacterium thermosaccharolyticum]PHO06825.1 diguanylate cyclase [Thermoanaerobacterium thermosaccharolyticum]